MVQVLLNTYNINDTWCYEELMNWITKDMKVIVIPFSFRATEIKDNNNWLELYGQEHGRYYHSIVDPLIAYDIKEDNIEWINYFMDSIESAKEKVLNSDIIYLTGGLPDKLMDRLFEFDLINLIEQHQGIIIGCSAGALVQIAKYHITPDEDYECFSYEKGLHLIEEFDIEVHYEGLRVQEDCIKRTIDKNKKKIYAIEEKGGIIYHHGDIKCLGNVHIFPALKTKTLSRAVWPRVIEKRFVYRSLNCDKLRGSIGLISLDKVKKPLVVSAGNNKITIVENGYYWLEFAPIDQNYWVTVMLDKEGKIVQYYFDITYKNIIREDGSSFFYDLYLDVVLLPNGETFLLDEEELEDALMNKVIRKSEFDLAYGTANDLMKELKGNERKFSEFCYQYFNKLKEVMGSVS